MDESESRGRDAGVDNVIEFEEKMAALSAGLSADGKALTRQVLDLELRNRFGDRTQLPDEFAARALKVVKGRPEEEISK
jgi:hypothetical protein